MSAKIVKFYLLLIIFGCSIHRGYDKQIIIIQTTPEKAVTFLEIHCFEGTAYNHPSFVIWTEDLNSNFIETLYVTNSIAKGVFEHGEVMPGEWKNSPGEVRRPASLPYWAHKRNILAPDGLYIPSPKTPVPDALTSATPQGSFVLETATGRDDRNIIKIMMEINQAWDSNKFWFNNKFEGDFNYFTSLQPAIVYEGLVDLSKKDREFLLVPVGHSHPTGANGVLFSDLSTLTSAKYIVDKIVVKVK